MTRLLPLAGYRVVDVTQVWAGPQLCSTMGDLGAEVIRVESTFGTDFGRLSTVPKSEFRLALDSQRHNRSRTYAVTLNLAAPEGNALFREIIRTADIFVCNLSPRVLHKLRISYADLRPLRPDLIMAVLSAAGQDGPWSDLMAYGPAFNAVIGHDSLVGYPETGELMCAYWDPDPAMASMALYAMMLAIWHRDETGEGQLIDLSFSEFLTTFLGEPLLEYQMTGRVPGPQGNRHPWMAPHGLYPCREPDTWLSIAVATDDEWRALGSIVGAHRPPASPSPPADRGPGGEVDFSTAALRRRNREALDDTISRWTRQHTNVEAMHILQAHGVAAAPAFTIAELYHDPHDTYRRTSVSIEAPGLKQEDLLFGIPWRLSETPGVVRRLGQPMGADNDRFFSQVLGLPETRIQELIERRVLA